MRSSLSAFPTLACTLLWLALAALPALAAEAAPAVRIPEGKLYPFAVGSAPKISAIAAPAAGATVAQGQTIRLKADIAGDSPAVTKRWTLTNPATGTVRTFFTNDIEVLAIEPGSHDLRLEAWSAAGKDERSMAGAVRVGPPSGAVYFVGPGGDAPDMGALAQLLASKGRTLRYGDVVAFKEGHDFGGLLNLTQPAFSPPDPAAAPATWVLFWVWHGDRKLGPANPGKVQRPRFRPSAPGQPAVAFNLQQNAARFGFAGLEIGDPLRQGGQALGAIAGDTWWEDCVFDGGWPAGSDGSGPGAQRFLQRYAPGNTRFSKVAFCRNAFRNILADAKDTSLLVLALNNDRGGNSTASGVWFIGNTLSNLRSLRAIRLYVVGVDDADVREAYFRNVVLAGNVFDGSTLMGAGASICNMPLGENYIGFNRLTNLRYGGSDPFNRIIGIWAGQLWNAVVEFNDGDGLTPTTGKDSIDNAILYPTDKGGKEGFGTLIGGKPYPYYSNNVHVRWNTIRNVANSAIPFAAGPGRGLKAFGGDIVFGYTALAVCCQQRDVYFYGNTLMDSGVGIGVAGGFEGVNWLFDNTVTGGKVGLHWHVTGTGAGQVNLLGNRFEGQAVPVAVADGWPGNTVIPPALEDYNRYVADRPPCFQKGGKHRGFEAWPAGRNSSFARPSSPAHPDVPATGACVETKPGAGGEFKGEEGLARQMGGR